MRHKTLKSKASNNSFSELVHDISSEYLKDPLISIVVPIFNQESILKRNLDSVNDAMSLPYEIIIINDASKDNSLHQIMSWANNYNFKNKLLSRIRVYSNNKEEFETKCDHFGITVSKGEFIIELQIDIQIIEKNLDTKLLSALEAHDDIFVISGRGTHSLDQIRIDYEQLMNWKNYYFTTIKTLFLVIPIRINKVIQKYLREFSFLPKNNFIYSSQKTDSYKEISNELQNLIFPNLERFKIFKSAGMVGKISQDKILIDNLEENKIWLSETVMRGPLIIDKKKYILLGGFDTYGFFLGNDDHDLAYRAWNANRRRTGFVPVGFISPGENGSTRKDKSIKTIARIIYLKHKAFKHKKTTGLYELAKSKIIVNVDPQIRTFPIKLKNTHRVN